jgi:hypothetical protein
MYKPSAAPAKEVTRKRSPMAVRIEFTVPYYRTPWRVSRYM